MGGLFHKEKPVGVIGQYQLLELLAKTSGSEIYRARRTGGKDVLELKLLTDDNPDRDRRLLRAVQILLRLNHPGILPLLDWGTDNHRHYLVTEPVGKPLEIPAGGGKPSWVLEVLKPIYGATIYLHAQGIIHRDLKPSSIFVSPAGKPRLAEFWLMRPDPPKRAVTLQGARVGTPAYMSPEQVAGATCTPASDQYSLGVLTYQLLKGRPPFEGDDKEVMQHHATDEVDVTGLPGGKVVAKMLAKDPAHRYPDVLTAWEELRAALA